MSAGGYKEAIYMMFYRGKSADESTGYHQQELLFSGPKKAVTLISPFSVNGFQVAKTNYESIILRY